jgi:hypothetical protein
VNLFLVKYSSLQIFIHFSVFLFALYEANPLFTGLRHEMSNSSRESQSNKGNLKNVVQASGSKHFHLIKYPPYCCGKRQTRLCTYEQTSSRVVLYLWGLRGFCGGGGGKHDTRALLLGSSDKDTEDNERTWTETAHA